MCDKMVLPFEGAVGTMTPVVGDWTSQCGQQSHLSLIISPSQLSLVTTGHFLISQWFSHCMGELAVVYPKKAIISVNIIVSPLLIPVIVATDIWLGVQR